MKHRLLGVLLILCVLIACSSALVPHAKPAMQPDVSAAAPDTEQVRAARFLNMLNHNYSYNEDFLSVDTLVNNAVLALLDRRDPEASDFIAAAFVVDYMEAMYGITVVDLSALNADFPQQDGYLYIIPRGYSTYTHQFVASTQNEDGTWTVTTKVSVFGHDGDFSCMATSLFVENDASPFGYCLVRSDLLLDVKTV